MDGLSRAKGCLLGLAVGDAVGTTVEFMPRGSFPPVKDMVGGGPFNLNPGEWTDDTSMALCLGFSMTEQGFDLKNQMERYLNWRNHGYMSSNGDCFDIGITTNQALQRYSQTGQVASGSNNPNHAGNGNIMRLAPVPIFYHKDLNLTKVYSIEQSKTTHQAPECLAAAELFGEILFNALNGVDVKRDVLLSKTPHHFKFTPKIQAIAELKYVTKQKNEIVGSGYVANSLEAALWCFLKTDNFKDAILTAVNLGDDADTTAAICGQIAGAYYGIDAIPESWRTLCVQSELIELLAEALYLKGES